MFRITCTWSEAPTYFRHSRWACVFSVSLFTHVLGLPQFHTCSQLTEVHTCIQIHLHSSDHVLRACSGLQMLTDGSEGPCMHVQNSVLRPPRCGRTYLHEFREACICARAQRCVRHSSTQVCTHAQTYSVPRISSQALGCTNILKGMSCPKHMWLIPTEVRPRAP